MIVTKVQSIFDRIFGTLFFILVVGTPLLFTSYTRSVFEVNKLLLLRVIIVIGFLIWFFKHILLKDNGEDNLPEESYNILGFKWKKIGLEPYILVWLGVNILSTIFSQNVKVSIIGAYDRWEGLITIFNYMMLLILVAKLTLKRGQRTWILIGILGSTAGSAVYGIFQSLGLDFMRWSVDPTARVFACINNPVHFCAYMGMVVPIGIAWILYIAAKDKTVITEIQKWTLFAVTTLIYYAQYLSFSRATWMAFVGAMTLFYLLVTASLRDKTSRSFFVDFITTSLFIGVFYFYYIFKLHLKNPYIAIGLGLLMLCYIVYLFINLHRDENGDAPIEASSILLAFILCVIIFLNYVMELSAFLPKIAYIPIHLAMTGYFLSMSFRMKGVLKKFTSRLVIIMLFATLQFVTASFTLMFLYFSLIAAFYLLYLKGNSSFNRNKKLWLTAVLIMFAVVIILPSMPSHLNALIGTKATQLKVTHNAMSKVDSYKRDALQGTARTSMWKSSLPWIKDHIVIGSGLDTIKYMYPKYRRPEYGILEGGHNYTPDRLHNEYLNTLATKGFLGFVVYYIGLIGGWFWIILNGFYKQSDNPNRYFLSGAMAGVLVYLGQVLFNFGVVATLVLFYVLMGIGIAMVKHPDFLGQHEPTS